MTAVPEAAGAPVALITGASRGIGAHLAAGFLAHGWRVAGTSRDANRLADLVEGGDGRAIAVAMDAAVPWLVTAAVERVMGEWGRIDLLINNAGAIEPEVPLWESDPDTWWEVVETNVRGPYLACREVLPGMVERGGGRIININSGAGTRERAELSAYTASKSALARITGAVHEAGYEQGIRAFDLAPGVVRTDMTTMMRMHQGRTEWTEPQDVVTLALALASGDLDDWSGRMVRAGVDDPAELRRRGPRLPADARKLRLTPWGDDDPVA